MAVFFFKSYTNYISKFSLYLFDADVHPHHKFSTGFLRLILKK